MSCSRFKVAAGFFAVLIFTAYRPAVGQTAADVEFMQGMIHHHAQALEMTDLVPDRSGSEKIHLLARRIEISQQDEIAWMRDWLERNSHDVAHVDHHDADHHDAPHVDESSQDTASAHDDDTTAAPLMPGMLTEEEMAQLAGATGVEFDRLFLQFMIHHHEGALTMVEDLLSAEGAAQDTDVFRIASGIDADQRAEIRRMQAMLDALSEP